MPADVTYSLFPASDEVLLQRQSSRRQRSRSRSRTPSCQRAQLPKRSTSLRVIPCSNNGYQDTGTPVERTPIERDETVMSDAVLGTVAPRSSKERNAVSPKEESVVQKPQEIRLNTNVSSTNPPRRSLSARSTESPMRFRPPTLPPPDRPLPPAPRTASAPKLQTSPALAVAAPTPFLPAVDSSKKHTRNNTNNTTSSTSTTNTAFRSPITPASDISSSSLFSPITPASARTSIMYPTVPKLSSSPAPSIMAAWSPPQRSNTRTTNSTSRTENTSYSHAHTQASGSDWYRSRTVPPGIQRSPSTATTAVDHRRNDNIDEHTRSNSNMSATNAAPINSLFPQYNHDLPYSRQEYMPNYARIQQGGPSSGPIINSKATTTGPSTQANAPPFPPRSQSLPDGTSSTINPTNNPTSTTPPSIPMPTFDPPPRRATTAPNTSSLRRRQRQKSISKPTDRVTTTSGSTTSTKKKRSLLTKSRPSPALLPQEDGASAIPPTDSATPTTTKSADKTTTKSAVALAAASARAAREDPADDSAIDDSPSEYDDNPDNNDTVALLPALSRANVAAVAEGRDYTITANTRATTKYDRPSGKLTTTATTTFLPPKDKASISPLSHSMENKTPPGQQQQQQQMIVRAPVHVADVAPNASGMGASEPVQHSMAVALGAVAFVMGVGVEVAGGMVGGLRRRPRAKS